MINKSRVGFWHSERDTNNAPLVTYTRGNDLSGTPEGAGGIGGLLARTAYLTNLTPSVWSAFYHADGNGNVTALVNPSGNRVAQYHYDPYGNLLASSGPLAEANLYRFSSKEYHANSGLVYYLYRYYDSNLQRWVNRDPLGDIASLPSMTAYFVPSVEFDNSGEMNEGDNFDAWADINRNLYGSIRNNPINVVDYLGLQAAMCNPAGAALVAEAEAAAAGFPTLAAQQAAARAAALAATAATLSGDRVEKTHTPGRDHDTKSGPKKKKEFQKKAEQKRNQEKKDLEDAWKKWKNLRPDQQKLRPDLKPTKPDPNSSCQ